MKPETTAKKKSLKREIFEWVMVFVVAFAIAMPIRAYAFEQIRVVGTSMINTLQDGERMFVTKYQYLFGDPQRFDVVICHYPQRGEENFVKRVVGVPGDIVAMHGGVLYVNGEAVQEPYIDNMANYEMDETVVAQGQYFVLGDNRSNSNDSHVPSVGPLEREQIVGKVRAVIWPLGGFRTIQ